MLNMSHEALNGPPPLGAREKWALVHRVGGIVKAMVFCGAYCRQRVFRSSTRNSRPSHVSQRTTTIS